MAEQELIMPKMGESIMEATILKWLKKEGDKIAADEALLEIATDKVDSEVPSPFEGTVSKILFNEGDVVEVGKPIALIATGASANGSPNTFVKEEQKASAPEKQPTLEEIPATPAPQPAAAPDHKPLKKPDSGRFYSPLVLNIAGKEGISMAELENIPGSGLDNRVTKKDILAYLHGRTTTQTPATETPPPQPEQVQVIHETQPAPAQKPVQGNVEIIEMDRMRRLIADHMVKSKHTSPHVTSFVEADVTNLVNWRNKVKADFLDKTGEKLTYTPLFIEAIIKAIKDFPLINSSVDGYNIIRKKDINIGMAAALPTGNLIVPVIKNADMLNLFGLAKMVNDLATRAREGRLKPDEIDGGTFTLTNVGTFGNLMGTPVINQPQAAIMATGVIKKKPAVLETDEGDVIAIRHMMFLSHAYDHRIIDGALGGAFLRRVADYLEAADPDRVI